MDPSRLPLRPAARPATVEELLKRSDEQPAEIIDGYLVDKAAPSFLHGLVQGALLGVLHPTFQRRSGGTVLGGWWLAPEVDVELEPVNVYRPDIAGWRRERMSSLPSQHPLRLRPDWVCEVLSRVSISNDLVRKLLTYHRTGVPHYWTVDPDAEVLTVYRWQEAGYLTVLTAVRGEVVRAEPFEALAWNVGVLFGDEPEPTSD